MDKVIKKSIYYLLVLITITTSYLSADKDEEPKTTSTLYRLHGIALFSGTDPFSAGIRFVTNSNYSHVGILLSEDGKDIADQSAWYCFESTGSADEILNKGELPHVRITPWGEVVKSYKGGMWLRTFTYEKDHEPTPQWVTEFVARFNGKPYEKNLVELLNAITGSNTKTDVTSVFCSELAAEMLLEAKLMESGISSNFTPHQFSTEYKLPLVGATLSAETVVHDPRPTTGCCILF